MDKELTIDSTKATHVWGQEHVALLWNVRSRAPTVAQVSWNPALLPERSAEPAGPEKRFGVKKDFTWGGGEKTASLKSLSLTATTSQSKEDTVCDEIREDTEMSYLIRLQGFWWSGRRAVWSTRIMYFHTLAKHKKTFSEATESVGVI